jgi:acyl-CoA synthetase (AMP-forming)/AMP-acid ligase II
VGVVDRAGEGGRDGDDVIAHCRAHLASYEKPSQVVFVDDLPTTITGKVKKQDLRARL